MYKLIVVDDELIHREGVKDICDWNELGFEITGIYSDGQEVIEILQYLQVDVIFTDIKMGIVSGI